MDAYDRLVESPLYMRMCVLLNDEPGLRMLLKTPSRRHLCAYVDKKQNNVLHKAVGSPGILRLFLKLPECAHKINDVNNLHYTPLYKACVCNCVESVKLLLDHDANPNMYSFYKNAALHTVSMHDRSAICKVLLEHGATVDIRNADHETPLHVAVSSESVGAVRVLMTYGANAALKNDAEETPMHLAVHTTTPHALDLLLRYGICHEERNARQRTAFELACYHARVEHVKIFLKHGIGPYYVGLAQETVLHVACFLKHGELLKLFLDSRGHVPVNDTDQSGHAPLHVAMRRRAYGCMRLLCQDPRVDKNLLLNDMTPLSHCIIQDDEVSLRLLLRAGADVHAPNADGRTVMQEAVVMNDASAVRLLMDHGGLAHDDMHAELMSLVAARGHVRIMRLFLAHGIAPGISNDQFVSALHSAVDGGHDAMILLLLTYDSDLNAYPDGMDILSFASAETSTWSMCLLLGCGARLWYDDPDIKSNMVNACVWTCVRDILNANTFMCVELLCRAHLPRDVSARVLGFARSSLHDAMQHTMLYGLVGSCAVALMRSNVRGMTLQQIHKHMMEDLFPELMCQRAYLKHLITL